MSIWTHNINAKFCQKILTGCWKIRQGVNFLPHSVYSVMGEGSSNLFIFQQDDVLHNAHRARERVQLLRQQTPDFMGPGNPTLLTLGTITGTCLLRAHSWSRETKTMTGEHVGWCEINSVVDKAIEQWRRSEGYRSASMLKDKNEHLL